MKVPYYHPVFISAISILQFLEKLLVFSIAGPLINFLLKVISGNVLGKRFANFNWEEASLNADAPNK